MKIVRSKVQVGETLHIILRKSEFREGRVDVLDERESLQLAALNLPEGASFRAHKHLLKDLNNLQLFTQEAWVVIEGRVEVTYYDIDDTEIEKNELDSGDVSITLKGGHAYVSKTKSLIYEFKSGPYFGPKEDKEYLIASREGNLINDQ